MGASETVLQAWQPFFTAQLGAAATLGGLVFVGLSLNLNKILAYAALPIRAMIALILLLLVLIVSSIVLVPGQTLRAIGIEIFIFAVMGWGLVTAMDLHVFRKRELQNKRQYVLNMILLQVATLPYLIGTLMVLLKSTSGFYLVAIGVVASFVKAVIDSWVLLVEINR
jgi:modulator of FtsH protease